MAAYRAARAPRRKAARTGPIRLPPDVFTPRGFEVSEAHPAACQVSLQDTEGSAGVWSAAPAGAGAGSGARWDHPVVRPYARGDKTAAAHIAGDPDLLARAIVELRGRVHAKTAVKPIRYKLTRWAELAKAAGHSDPWAFTERLIIDVMAALVEARFRSAGGYLNAARQAFVANGGQVTDTIRLLCRNLARAARRGQGPPRQSSGLPLERCGELPGGPEPWAKRGPTRPRAAIVVGAWWLLREIELSAVTIGQVTDKLAGGVGISLPASKCDAVGTGATRSHVCVCDLAPAAASICPACTVRALVSARKLELGKRADWQGEPLFPDVNGARCTKAGIQATIVAAAATLGLETRASTGALLFTGHALRATGAMCLAAAGLDANSVGLLGRWGSDVVRIYMREAPLRALQTVARAVVAPAVPTISAQLAPAWAPLPGTPAAAFDPGEPYVLNMGPHGNSPVAHAVRLTIPAYCEPRSECCWRFRPAGARARRCASIPVGAVACKQCFRSAPSLIGDETSSTSSSSDSSGSS